MHILKSKSTECVRLIVQNPAISDKWLIELVEGGTTQVKVAAVPELVRRLKAKLHE